MVRRKSPKVKELTPTQWFIIALVTACMCYLAYYIYTVVVKDDEPPPGSQTIPSSLNDVLEWTLCSTNSCAEELGVIASLRDKNDTGGMITAAFNYGKCVCNKCPQFIDKPGLTNGFTKEDCKLFNEPPSSEEMKRSMRGNPRAKVYAKKFKNDLDYMRMRKSKR